MTVPLRFVVDMGVGISVEDYLRSAECDVVCVRDVDVAMNDQAILEWAVKDNRIVLTMDKDFGELHFRMGLPHAGVLLLRLDDADGEEKVQAVKLIIASHAADLLGRFCVFHDGNLRVR